MPAPDCPCPICQRPGYPLSVNDLSAVDYYRCDFCQHTWTVPKHECEPTEDVTIREPGP